MLNDPSSSDWLNSDRYFFKYECIQREWLKEWRFREEGQWERTTGSTRKMAAQVEGNSRDIPLDVDVGSQSRKHSKMDPEFVQAIRQKMMKVSKGK
ncbi:hypothetical protein V2J09_022728 [Rumex salicifolius]